MKLSALGGLISASFLSVLLLVAFGAAFHYWQQLQLPRIGPRKKQRIRKLMRTWTLIAIGIAVIGLSGTAVYLFAPAAILIQPLEKPYLALNTTEMDALTEGATPVLRFNIENGRLNSTVKFRRISFRVTPFAPETFLTYLPEGYTQKFVIPPHQKVTARWAFNGVILTKEQIEDLNANPPNAELYFFAEAEYSDETGTHPLRACWRYDKDFPNHVAFCADDMKFR